MTTREWLLAALAATVACMGGGDKGGGDKAADRAELATRPEGTAMALDEGKMGKGDATTPAAAAPASRATGAAQAEAFGGGGIGHDDRAKDSPTNGDQRGGKNEKKLADKGGGNETATRAWFPETFLFDPLVVTDAHGDASVQVRVPDRLTTWRVLALAHSRTGAQGGAVASFLGTLPTYVDPIVPKRLVIGDRVRLPVQLVNTTETAVAGTLSLGADGAELAGNPGARTIPGAGSLVDYAELSATRAGTAVVHAKFAATAATSPGDAVDRAIEVAPAGRPVDVVRSGTLAAPRTLDIAGIAGDDPQTDRVRLLAFPGALALLRAELAASSARSGAGDDAYALLLAGRAADLLAKLGDKADPDVLRNLAIVAGQRALRDARTLDVATAALLVEPALAHPNNPVLARLGERAADYLSRAQRPDGTFSGATGWTLQRVLVATADATRAVRASSATQAARQRAQGVVARATGAFDRRIDRVEDPYTAASILASGAVLGDSAAKLAKVIRDHVKDGLDGAKYVDAGAGVVRADGTVPSRSLTTALAILALAGNAGNADDAALRADLGATLLGGYSPTTGWGDGVDNLACMQAVLALFDKPLPSKVDVHLEMDGKVVASGELSPDKLRDVVALDAHVSGLGAAHTWRVVAEPAVPGLGFSLALQGHVPWQPEASQGVELAVHAPATAKVGAPADVTVIAAAPSGLAIHVINALPAGVQADRPSLEALVDNSAIQRFEIEDGAVELWIAPLDPGQTRTATYRVIPTLAGTLHSPASSIDAGGVVVHVPPVAWTIANG
jgi:hypothetical protein